MTLTIDKPKSHGICHACAKFFFAEYGEKFLQKIRRAEEKDTICAWCPRRKGDMDRVLVEVLTDD